MKIFPASFVEAGALYPSVKTFINPASRLVCIQKVDLLFDENWNMSQLEILARESNLIIRKYYSKGSEIGVTSHPDSRFFIAVCDLRENQSSSDIATIP